MGSTALRSWRFEESVDQLPHVALYVKEALRLNVRGALVPPRLVATVPDRSALLRPVERRDVELSWVDWWTVLTGRMQGPDPMGEAPIAVGSRESSEWGRERAAKVVVLLDPPQWNTLADHPVLREVVRELSGDAVDFAETVRRDITLRRTPPCAFAWDTARRAAETVAADTGTDVGRLDASADVLAVDGVWWRVLRPGKILCSVATADDPDRSYEALTDAFMSLL